MISQESVENKQLQASPEAGASTEKLDSALEGTGRVSEIVGESAGENQGDSIKTGKKSSTGDDKALSSLSGEAKKVVLPSVAIQKKKIRKVLMKKQKELVKEARKLERSRDFSADKLETLITQIRKIQYLLSDLVTSAKERINALYEQYVLGKS